MCCRVTASTMSLSLSEVTGSVPWGARNGLDFSWVHESRHPAKMRDGSRMVGRANNAQPLFSFWFGAGYKKELRVVIWGNARCKRFRTDIGGNLFASSPDAAEASPCGGRVL